MRVKQFSSEFIIFLSNEIQLFALEKKIQCSVTSKEPRTTVSPISHRVIAPTYLLPRRRSRCVRRPFATSQWVVVIFIISLLTYIMHYCQHVLKPNVPSFVVNVLGVFPRRCYCVSEPRCALVDANTHAGPRVRRRVPRAHYWLLLATGSPLVLPDKTIRPRVVVGLKFIAYCRHFFVYAF